MDRASIATVVGVVSALAAPIEHAWAQHTADARVSIHVVPPAIPFATVDAAVASAARDSTGAPAPLLPAGARLVLREQTTRRPSADPTGEPRTRRRIVRTITLEYAAN